MVTLWGGSDLEDAPGEAFGIGTEALFLGPDGEYKRLASV